MKKTTLSTMLALWMLGLSTLVVAGCNTTEGIGEDVESAGEAIQEEAEEASE